MPPRFLSEDRPVRVTGIRYSPDTVAMPSGNTTSSVKIKEGVVVKEYSRQGLDAAAFGREALALRRLCGDCIKTDEGSALRIKEPLAPGLPVSIFTYFGSSHVHIQVGVIKQIELLISRGIVPNDFKVNSSMNVAVLPDNPTENSTGLPRYSSVLEVKEADGQHFFLTFTELDFGGDFILPGGEEFQEAVKKLAELANQYGKDKHTRQGNNGIRNVGIERDHRDWTQGINTAISILNKGLQGFTLEYDVSGNKVIVQPNKFGDVPFRELSYMGYGDSIEYTIPSHAKNPYSSALALALLVYRTAISSIIRDVAGKTFDNTSLFGQLSNYLGLSVNYDGWNREGKALESQIVKIISRLFRGESIDDGLNFVLSINKRLAQIFAESVEPSADALDGPLLEFMQRRVTDLENFAAARDGGTAFTNHLGQNRLIEALGLERMPSDDYWIKSSTQIVNAIRVETRDKPSLYIKGIISFVRNFIKWHNVLQNRSPDLYRQVKSSIALSVLIPPWVPSIKPESQEEVKLNLWSQYSLLLMDDLFKNGLSEVFSYGSIEGGQASDRLVNQILESTFIPSAEKQKYIVSIMLPLLYYRSLLPKGDRRREEAKEYLSRIEKVVKEYASRSVDWNVCFIAAITRIDSFKKFFSR